MTVEITWMKLYGKSDIMIVSTQIRHMLKEEAATLRSSQNQLLTTSTLKSEIKNLERRFDLVI